MIQNLISLEAAFNVLVGVFFLVSWVIVFVTLYHLTRFGIGTQPKKIAALFLLGSLAFSGVALMLFLETDINIVKTFLPQ